LKNKVASFRHIKEDELNRRVAHSESVVQSIQEAVTPETADVKRFEAVQQEIAKISFEISELSKYTRLNYSGFLKVKVFFTETFLFFFFFPFFNHIIQ